MSSGQYGSGPGLTDPKDPIQNSDAAYKNHLEKQANAVGPSPATQRPSNGSQYEHVEHREHAQSPQHQSPSDNLENGSTPSKTQQELKHHQTLSSIRTRLGLASDPPILDGHDVHEHLKWSSIRTIFREPFAEFFGVFIMILFGDGSVAQVLLSTGKTAAPGGDGFGSYQSISWG